MFGCLAQISDESHIAVVYGKRNPQMPVASDPTIPVLASVRIAERAFFSTMDAGIGPHSTGYIKSTCDQD